MSCRSCAASSVCATPPASGPVASTWSSPARTSPSASAAPTRSTTTRSPRATRPCATRGSTPGSRSTSRSRPSNFSGVETAQAGTLRSVTDTFEDLGPNSGLVDEMYRQYVADPGSVAPSWQEFFSDYVPAGTAPRSANGGDAPPPATPSTPPVAVRAEPPAAPRPPGSTAPLVLDGD